MYHLVRVGGEEDGNGSEAMPAKRKQYEYNYMMISYNKCMQWCFVYGY